MLVDSPLQISYVSRLVWRGSQYVGSWDTGDASKTLVRWAWRIRRTSVLYLAAGICGGWVSQHWIVSDRRVITLVAIPFSQISTVTVSDIINTMLFKYIKLMPWAKDYIAGEIVRGTFLLHLRIATRRTYPSDWILSYGGISEGEDYGNVQQSDPYSWEAHVR